MGTGYGLGAEAMATLGAALRLQLDCQEMNYGQH
jgi:hypothetical protein